MKNPANAVMIPAKMIAIKTKIERSLFLRTAINPVTRLVKEQVPATKRDRKGRGKGSTNGFSNSWNRKNNTREAAMRIIEDFPERVVAK